jgi:hypothetical protein
MTKYVYIGRVKKLNLLRIAVVDFVPHSNREKLKISEFNDDVDLLYERAVYYDFLPNNGIKKYKTPLGNDLYDIPFEEALEFIDAKDGVDFYKGEDVANKQIATINQDIKNYVEKIEKEKLLTLKFLKEMDLKFQELDRHWRLILEKNLKIYQNYCKQFSLVGRLFGGIITTKPWILEANKRDELVDNILKEVPQSIKFKCGDRFKSQIELSIEPAISIKDEEKLKLRDKGVNCQEIVNLKITLVHRLYDESIGEEVYVKNAEGKCTNCLREHQISFPEGRTLLYFRDDKNLINDFLKKGI